MIIKLRDMTLEQYEKWKEAKCPTCNRENKLSCHKCVFNGVDCAINLASCWIYHKDMFSDKFLNQEVEIENEPILTEEEKEYLSCVIRPFRDSVEYIYVNKTDKLYLAHNEPTLFIHLTSDFNIVFPTMGDCMVFEKMKDKKTYTLEELGL